MSKQIECQKPGQKLEDKWAFFFLSFFWAPVIEGAKTRGIFMGDAPVGIIGGSGLYAMKDLVLEAELTLETPFGAPSAPYVKGRLKGRSVVFLARHGKGHVIPPTAIPFRANIWGFRKLGVRQLFSVSAVGSLREDIPPGELVVPDQFIDRTRLRANSFFDAGIVAHVSFADPFCPHLRKTLVDGLSRLNIPSRDGGTYVCMEGPAFSTRAESQLYRSWGGHVIGMTNLPEAKLAREAEICYATLALSTDYDCWREEEAAVTADQVVMQICENVGNAQRALAEVIPSLADLPSCACRSALSTALLTDLKLAPKEAKERLALFLERFI